MYAPLHVKSHYSVRGGITSPRALVERARSLGLPAIALTDAGTIAGQVEFHHLAREAGLLPISGVELGGRMDPTVPPQRGGETAPGRVVLLARDRAGWESICRTLTRRNLAGR